MGKEISKSVLKRLPAYLTYLKSIDSDVLFISATAIANALDLGEVQVRKDLAMVSDGGRPKVGYNRQNLIQDIQQFLGYDNVNEAVLIGVGNLGGALLGYSGFAEYGMNIVAAFDANPNLVGTVKSGKAIRAINDLNTYVKDNNILLGIITVPADYAQGVCDQLIRSGVKAILNFAPVHLVVPDGILVQDVNMAASLAILSKHLSVEIEKRRKQEEAQL